MSGNRDERITDLAEVGAIDPPSSWRESVYEDEVDSNAANPIDTIKNALYGRWRWAFLISAVLSPILAGIGYKLGPIKYSAVAVLGVEARLNPLIANTPETEEIRITEFVSEQTQLVKNPSVLYEAFRSDRLAKALEEDPDLRRSIAAGGLKVTNPRGSPNILVQFDGDEPKVAAEVVNAVVAAYFGLYRPRMDVEFARKKSEIEQLIERELGRVAQLESRRAEREASVPFGVSDILLYRDDLIGRMMESKSRLEVVRNLIDKLEADVRQREIELAASEGRSTVEADLQPKPEDFVRPTIDDLSLRDDPELPTLLANLQREQAYFQSLDEKFGKNHQEYRRAKTQLNTQEAIFRDRMKSAESRWYLRMNALMSYAALTAERAQIEEDLAEIRREDEVYRDIQNQIIGLNDEIEVRRTRVRDYQARLAGLEREKDVITPGRIFERASAFPPIVPSSDKRMAGLIGGALGGFGIGFASVLLFGLLNPKTFGVQQLEGGVDSLRVLGVMPNMDPVDEDVDLVNMATDCVHRLRARIETRRSPERGYALMISSPFQGDGKTTLAVSLGWSYAESGYKTLLMDTDFVGRAMSHQFGRLRSPGLREILKNGVVDDEVKELGHPNLNLLSIGFDRRVSAANLNPRMISNAINMFRDDYDIIILDTGPLTASLEAMPVAAAADGAILSLRRGRSKTRLRDCIYDLRQAGTDYLGVVLNYAQREDCLRYGSMSRVSEEIQHELADDAGAHDSNVPVNPLLDNIRSGISER